MHADIHKRAEVDDVAHRARQLHAGLQVLHAPAHPCAAAARAARRAGRGPACSSSDTISRRVGSPTPQLHRQLRPRQRLSAFARLPADAAASARPAAHSRSCSSSALRRGVALGVNAGARPADLRRRGTRRKPAHCSNAFGPSFGTFLSCARDGERAVFLPVGHNVLRHRVARCPPHACSSGADAVFRSTPTAVHAVLHHAAERFVQLGLRADRADTAPRRWPSGRSSPARPAGPAAAARWKPR